MTLRKPPWIALRQPETADAEDAAADAALERGDRDLAETLRATAHWQRTGTLEAWERALKRTAEFQRSLGIEPPDDPDFAFGPLATVEPPCSRREEEEEGLLT